MTLLKTKFADFVLKYKVFFLLISAVILTATDDSFTAWFCYVPVFFLIEELSLKNAWLIGGVFGVLFALFYAFWLFKFSIPAMICIWILFFIVFAAQFEFLKLAQLFGGKFRTLLYILIPVVFEYLRTLGFAGFNYTLLGYTQYKNLYLIQISRFAGVFAVSFLLYFSSVVIFEFLNDFKNRRPGTKNLVQVLAFFVLLVSAIIYGFISVQLTDARDKKASKLTVSAVQHNPNPNNAGFEQYKADVETLINLTEEALNENPEIKIVLWPETAVVPSILNHYGNEKNPERRALIEGLLNYMNSKECAFVIGNFHREGADDFNSVYFFEGGKNVIPPRPVVYRKNHLVPFSEYLPFADKFPRLRDFLTRRNNFLWTPGSYRNVFTYRNEENAGLELKFCTPVCFEDTFGRDIRKFRKNGARAIFNLSNDSWSHSYICQEQHLKMAVFRSVENRVPSVRSTASGETCIISSSGRIIKRILPFEKSYLIGEIPVLTE